MGFQVADTVTGRVIGYGDPVVAFLVSPAFDIYPLKDDPLQSATRCTDYYRLESLPIFGTYEDTGNIEVTDEDAHAVQLALMMTGAQNWEDFSENYLRQSSQNNPGLGLALMHESTYRFLAEQGRSAMGNLETCDGYPGLHRQAADREPDVAAVLSMMDQGLRNRAAFSDEPDLDRTKRTQLYGWAKACSLRGDLHEENIDGLDVAALPNLHSVLSTNAGIFGKQFTRFLIDRHLFGAPLHAATVPDVSALPNLPGMLRELWHCQQLANRMYDVHAFFMPAPYAGSDNNRISVIELAMLTIETALTSYLGQHPSHVTHAGEPALSKKIEKLEKLVDQLKALQAGTSANVDD